jgi:hypothetical protein
MEMTRLVLNYVKQLEGMSQPAAGMTGTAPAASKTKALLQNGFPKLPSDFDGMKYNKKDLEELYRDYIGTHYCKWFHVDNTHTVDTFVGNATEHRTRQAPWSRMKEDTLKYVDAEYLPWPDFVLDDPQALKLEVLRAYFAYIAEREKTFALDEVFRFKYVEANRKEARRGSEDDNIGAGPIDSSSNAAQADGPGDAEHHEGRGIAGTSLPDCQDGPNDTHEGVDTPRTGEIPPPAPAPLPNTATGKKTKNSCAPTRSKKNTAVPEGTQPQEAGSGDAEQCESHGIAGMSLPDCRDGPNDTHDGIDAPRTGEITPSAPVPLPNAATLKTTKKTRAPTKSKKPRAVHSAADAEGAATPARPRPKPCPVTGTGPQSSSRHGEEASHQVPGTCNDPQPPMQAHEIDPSLLALSSQRSRALVNTSDNLALQEASRFSVTGKRVPKKKQQV